MRCAATKRFHSALDKLISWDAVKKKTKQLYSVSHSLIKIIQWRAFLLFLNEHISYDSSDSSYTIKCPTLICQILNMSCIMQ